MSTHIQFAIDLSRQVGQLLEGYFHSTNLRAELKADNSIVTEADLAADHMITTAIQERYPDDSIISEELQPDQLILSSNPAASVWVVDPLDGTTNFSLGLHIWGVLLTRLVNGWPDTAVLFFPIINELYSAQRGHGAFLNGKPIQVAPSNDRRRTPFFACCSRSFRRYQISVPYKTRILGSAAYTFCAVARGVAILGLEVVPKIWDIAAPWLLVSEAGGIIEPFEGNPPFPLKPEINYAQLDIPTLAAANPELISKARRQIIPK